MSSRSGSRTSGSVPGAAVVHTHTEADVTNLTTDLATKLAKASNLSDLASAATARTNLGVPADSSVVHLTGAEVIAGVKTFSSEPVAPSIQVTGTTGAPNTGRFVGVTASGAPTSGTYGVGDYIVTQNGQMFVCTAAGTPGTWVTPRDTTNLLTVGEETFTRDFATTSTGMTSQALRLTYFTARKTETTTQVRVLTTPTLCRVGLYSIASNGDGTLVASTANDTTLFAAASTAYTKSWSVAYAKVSGQRYAIGVLVVSSVTVPTIIAALLNTATEPAIDPRLSGSLGAQSDLPSSFTSASVAAASSRPYAAVLP